MFTKRLNNFFHQKNQVPNLYHSQAMACHFEFTLFHKGNANLTLTIVIFLYTTFVIPVVKQDLLPMQGNNSRIVGNLGQPSMFEDSGHFSE